MNTIKYWIRCFLLWSIWSIPSVASSSQNTLGLLPLDSLSIQSDSIKTLSQTSTSSLKATRNRKTTFDPSPKKAILCSLIPGGGQIYNRKYWKLPLVMGAYTAIYYAITWNNTNLLDYTHAYRDIKSDKPLENTSWVDFIPINAKPEDYVNNTSFQDQLKRGRDFFRRNRDLSIIVGVGVYFLIMVDAYVDAELFHFDISPNVALQYTPMITPTIDHTSSLGHGVSLAWKF